MPGPLDRTAGDDLASQLDKLSSQLETERKMREVTETIHSLSFDEIVLSARDDIQRLVNCERVTIFAKDPRSNQIYSRSMDGGGDQGDPRPDIAGQSCGLRSLSKEAVARRRRLRREGSCVD